MKLLYNCIQLTRFQITKLHSHMIGMAMRASPAVFQTNFWMKTFKNIIPQPYEGERNQAGMNVN